MTTARLTYNSINIDFEYGAKIWQVDNIQEYSSNRSVSGVIERINSAGLCEIDVELVFDNDVNDQMYTFWWSWGRLGREFEFCIDSSKMVTTTLDGAAASGQKVIPATSTTGFTAGDRCLLIADANQEREVITIASISAGVSVTAVSNLNNSFASGDEFRYFDYFPALVMDSKSFKPSPMAGFQLWNITLRFIEVIGYSGALLGDSGGAILL